ncbi:spermidine dehydrogenase [Novosphingobium hassiacum]|uniref:Spermidine dehydrogenase n=1 Tax=Novosphingobium hassiacum TaxID=173676 RepID=A0A7W5ZWL2_9SPHN|nr:FAD/NAD(P)-binding protein [Novosphingobium hassiacum]MBB3861278.1 spermidine dehydrogenase [Novosphingobium hassiacum]
MGNGKKGGVTRRDFVGGTLVGSGAALMTAAAPSVISPARAQTFAAPLNGLGPEWTGPGGVGDYAGKNGNTADVVNAAHGHIRNGDLDKRIANAPVVDELYDLVIVGAGISGLTSAYRYRQSKPDAKILILDQHAIFGGEAKQNDFDVDGHRLTGPQGSTGIVVPFARASQLGFAAPILQELGFPETFKFQEATGLSKPLQIPHDAWGPMHISWERGDTAFFYEDKGMVINPWQNSFRDAPIPDKIKRALVDLELYRTPPRREDWAQWLDSMTYKAFLLDVVGVPADCIDGVLEVLSPVMAAMGCGQGGDVISAYSAYNFLQPGVNGYYRYQFDGQDPTDVLYLASFPGGNGIVARKLLKRTKPEAIAGADTMTDVMNGKVQWDQLDQSGQNVRMRLSSTVFSVVHEGKPAKAKTVRVTYDKDGKLLSVRAKAVICSGQQHANRRICHDINAEYREAMGAFHHAPMLVINVALRNWRFLDKIGVSGVRWFNGFGWWTSLRRNLVVDGQETQPLDPNKPVVLTQYIPFLLPDTPFPEQCTAARMQLFSMSYADIEAQVREQFTKMFGPYGFDDKRDIAGIVTNRQGHAYFVGAPGFFFGKDGKKAPKDVLQTPFHRIAFGHSELAGAQMWETAVAEGERAARQIAEMPS